MKEDKEMSVEDRLDLVPPFPLLEYEHTNGGRVRLREKAGG